LKSNVVLITIDSLRSDSVGFLNDSASCSPFLDSLASRGIVFRNAFSTGGGTPFAMSGLMTSAYPMSRPEDRGILGWPTLASMFKSTGYQTGAFHSNPWLSRAAGYDVGFDEFHDIPGPIMTEGPVGLRKKIPWALSEFIQVTFNDSPPYLRAQPLLELARKWVERRDRELPFFLWVHLMDAHFPYAAPSKPLMRMFPGRWLSYATFFIKNNNFPLPSLASKSQLMGMYQECIRYIDQSLKEFCSSLPPDTVIAVLADHGDAFGEHGYFGHPGNLYNEILKIPALVYHPNLKHTIVKQAVSATEMGRIIFDVSNGEQPRDFGTRPVFAMQIDFDTRVRHTALISGDWKLMVDEWPNGNRRRTQLFNLVDDPLESLNLAEQEAGITNSLTLELERILSCIEKDRFRLIVSRTQEFETSEAEKRSHSAMTKDEEEDVKVRLKRLGYD
jgi:membrane-anchored protein YejM (alkaline phosphatase superfamily)